MKSKSLFFFGALALSVLLSACGFVGQQLADKAREDQLLKPGALDHQLTMVYDSYQFKFLDKYRITHEWPRNSNGCQYRSLPTLNVKNGRKGEVYAVPDIYELDGVTWQASNTGRPPWNFDSFVRSQKVMSPVYGLVNGVRQKTGEERIENGWTPVCLQTWGGTSHSLTYFFFKRSTSEWGEMLPAWGFTKLSLEQTVGSNKWRVYTASLRPAQINKVSGPFQIWLLPIGTTGYTIALQLGANQNSLRSPEAHARMQVMLQHLVESVKIEMLQP